MRTGTKLGLLALAVALGCMALWNAAIQNVDIPENRTLFVVGFLAAVVLGIAAFVKRTHWIGGLAAVVAIFLGMLLPFTIAISRQELPTAVVQVGDALPSFTSTDDRGEPFDSASLQGKPVLMKFFRGHW